MNTKNNEIKMKDLNNIEKSVLQELFKSSSGNGHDFGFTDDVNCEKIGITRRQLSGYISQLEKKDYIRCYGAESFYQFSFTKKGFNYFDVRED